MLDAGHPPDPAASPTHADRVHRYDVHCSWQGSTGAGYEKYERAHVGGAPPAAAALALSSDPAFLGDAALLNPEQLLVMSASSCQLLSFLAVAARARVDVVTYEDHAEGVMPEDDPPARIKTIWLRPRIVVAADSSGAQATEARVRQLVELAHRECFIANSLRSDVIVEPTVEWR